MTWDPHREDEARWIQAMKQRHERGQEHVCGLADVLRTLEERDEARAEVARREREHAALLETAQKALATTEAERDALKARIATMQESLSMSCERRAVAHERT